MKKITLFTFAIVALSLASCKKDRTCTCSNTETITPTGLSINSTSQDVTVMTKVSKGTALANCQSTRSSEIHPYLGVDYTHTIESTCTLK